MHDIHEARHLENKMSGCSWASWGEWVWCLPVSHSANSSWQKQSSCYKMTGNRDKTESSQTLILNPNSEWKVHTRTVWICCTGNGAFGLTGHTGQWSPLGLFFSFPVRYPPYPHCTKLIRMRQDRVANSVTISDPTSTVQQQIQFPVLSCHSFVNLTQKRTWGGRKEREWREGAPAVDSFSCGFKLSFSELKGP